MKEILVSCVLGLAMMASPAKAVDFNLPEKTVGVMVSVDAIEYVETSSTGGSIIHLNSGQTIFTEKSWSALTEIIKRAVDKDQDFIVVYKKVFKPMHKPIKESYLNKGTLR